MWDIWNKIYNMSLILTKAITTTIPVEGTVLYCTVLYGTALHCTVRSHLGGKAWIMILLV